MRFNLENRLQLSKPYRILSWTAIKNLRASPITNLEGSYKLYREIGERLVETCLTEGGIGLAAPQIGLFKRMFLIREFEKSGETFLPSFKLYLNPNSTGIPEEGKTKDKELCLSVPGKGVLIERFNKIQASWFEFDEEGNVVPQEEILEGHLAHVFAHEFDHLNGISIPQRWEIQNKKKKPTSRGNKKK